MHDLKSLLTIILIYSRSQKTNQLQRDCGIFLAQHGLSRIGQAAGQILGDSIHHRTVDTDREKMAQEHDDKINTHIMTSNQVSVQGYN